MLLERYRPIKNAKDLPPDKVVSLVLNRLADAGFRRVALTDPVCEQGIRHIDEGSVVSSCFVRAGNKPGNSYLMEIADKPAGCTHEFSAHSLVWLSPLYNGKPTDQMYGQSVAAYLGRWPAHPVRSLLRNLLVRD